MATTLDKLVDTEEKAEAAAEGLLQTGKDAEAEVARLIPIVREVEGVKKRRDDTIANAKAQQQRAKNRIATLKADPGFAKARADLRALLKTAAQAELDGLLGTDPIKDIVVPPLAQKYSLYRTAKIKADGDVAKAQTAAGLKRIDADAKRLMIDVQIDALMNKIGVIGGAAGTAVEQLGKAQKGVAVKDAGNAYAALYQMLLANDIVDTAAPVDAAFLKDLTDACDAYGDSRTLSLAADDDLRKALTAQSVANENLALATAALALELNKKKQ